MTNRDAIQTLSQALCGRWPYADLSNVERVIPDHVAELRGYLGAGKHERAVCHMYIDGRLRAAFEHALMQATTGTPAQRVFRAFRAATQAHAI